MRQKNSITAFVLHEANPGVRTNLSNASKRKIDVCTVRYAIKALYQISGKLQVRCVMLSIPGPVYQGRNTVLTAQKHIYASWVVFMRMPDKYAEKLYA